MKKVHIITLGCKMNLAESAGILDQFTKNGYFAGDLEDSEVIIINSCTVTNRTDFKSRNVLRKAEELKRLDPAKKIIVTGCFSQINHDSLQKNKNIDLLVDNNKKNEVFQKFIEQNNSFTDILTVSEFSEYKSDSMLERSRAFLKIQDGCDNYCAYCIVPFARGHNRSRAKENVLAQVQSLIASGYKEFVLGGINLGLYGQDKQENYYLSDLLWDLENIPGLEILRISSLEPQLFTQAVLDFLRQSKKVAPHLHIPLQSGSDTLLKSMKRRYNTKEFQDLISTLHGIIPNLALGCDVIVGLPGETDALFQETYDFLNQLDFTYLHTFIYSKRAKTEAALMKEQVHGTVAKERSRLLRELAERKTESYKQIILEKKVDIKGIMEDKVGEYWTALSNRFIRVYLKNKEELKGKLLTMKPLKLFKDGMEVVEIDRSH